MMRPRPRQKPRRSLLKASIRRPRVQPTSRRLCNAAYALWVLAQVGLCFGLCVLCVLLQTRPAPLLLDAVNRRQLAVFLLANVLTGGINLLGDGNTRQSSDAWAAVVLFAYMGAVCAAAPALLRLT